MTTMNLFRADGLAAEHAPVLCDLMSDRAALQAAGEALAAMERLIGRLTPRAILAALVAGHDADRAGVLTAVHELATSAAEAAAARHADAEHVTEVLRADGAKRRGLDSVAAARLRIARDSVRGVVEELAAMDGAGNAEAEKLRAAGLSPGELAALLQARAEGAGQRRDELQAQAAGWRAETAVLAEYFADVMRDRCRLGRLAAFLAAEHWPSGDAGRLAVEARWRAAGPVALAS